ncbi:uncharacterized protein [Haliotis asinina]|uniref:uncharacterized protein n=1 Tax=Haliotis asinina TaxID=109174 RepID=UPI00353199F9
MASNIMLLLLPALFHSFKACPSIRFVTEERLTDKTSDVDLIRRETFQLRAECAVKCVRTFGCLSVFYEQTSGTCRLHSKYFEQSDSGLVTNAGFMYLELVCPGLDPAPSVSGGTVQLFTDGSLAALKVVCDYRHRFTGPDTATCFEDVDWNARGTCEENRWFNLTTPFVKYFPVPPRVGTKITLVGRAGTNKFQVIVKQAHNVTVALTANQDPGQIKLAKKYLGSWGHYITDTTDALNPTRNVFTLTLDFASDSELKGTIIGNSFYNFTYPVLVSLDSLKIVQVKEDVSVNELHINWP